MSQQTIATSAAPEVIVEQVHGNLQVKGWDRDELVIKANPDDLTLAEHDDVITLSCRGDCVIRLPEGASLRVASVDGEARFKLLEDQLTVGEVRGSLVLRNVAETHVETVHGELLAKQLQGSLRIGRVHGNAAVREVQGECLIENVYGNLDVRNVESSLQVETSGNARVRLSEMAGTSYRILAHGNLHCSLPETASARVELSSEGQSISIRLAGESQSVREPEFALDLGAGEVPVRLSAGGAIFLSTQAPGWGGAEDAGAEFGEDFTRISEEFNQQVAEQIEAQIEAQMEAINRQLNEQIANLTAGIGRAGLSPEETERIIQRARESSERATARAQEKMSRAQEKLARKLEAARRRTEMKAQAAERRSQSRSGRVWNFGGWPAPPPPPAPPKEPVSDEERLLILRMLEQKKISLEEAEKLLAALDEKG